MLYDPHLLAKAPIRVMSKSGISDEYKFRLIGKNPFEARLGYA